MDENDHITVQIVPFDRGSAFEASYGAFTILNFPYRTDTGIVYVEHRSGGVFLETLHDLDSYSLLFKELSKMALSPSESTRMLLRSAGEYAAAG